MPANLFTFNAPSFHPIYAETFLLNFQHIIIKVQTFDSAIGLLLNTLALSHHTGIMCLWTCDSVVRDCTLKWSHSCTQPWGNPVPYQCPSCWCIQSWAQRGNRAWSELGRDVTMCCLYQGKQGQQDGCCEYLKFDRPSEPFKCIKLLEEISVAIGLKNSNFCSLLLCTWHMLSHREYIQCFSTSQLLQHQSYFLSVIYITLAPCNRSTISCDKKARAS